MGQFPPSLFLEDLNLKGLRKNDKNGKPKDTVESDVDRAVIELHGNPWYVWVSVGKGSDPIHPTVVLDKVQYSLVSIRTSKIRTSKSKEKKFIFSFRRKEDSMVLETITDDHYPVLRVIS